MSFKLEKIPADNYLHFRVTGDNNPQVAMQYLAEINRICVDSSLTGVLIEEHLTGPGMGMADIYEVVDTSAQMPTLLRQLIAYVDTNPEHSQRDMQFAETMANNRGIRVRVFETVAEAKTWLEETLT